MQVIRVFGNIREGESWINLEDFVEAATYTGDEPVRTANFERISLRQFGKQMIPKWRRFSRPIFSRARRDLRTLSELSSSARTVYWGNMQKVLQKRMI
jgi:hypothetical protein